MATHKAHASPTKDFFVRMITKDISIEDCILDLIDNCLDGARKSINKNSESERVVDYTGFYAKINFSNSCFSIVDNCGGIKISEAIDYAFHFGRRVNGSSDGDYSIGLYGIGMKRAIFKIGNSIKIFSSTGTEAFTTTINVSEWLLKKKITGDNLVGEDDWDFDMEDSPIGESKGTQISVDELHDQISAQFNNPAFSNGLARIIARDYAQFLSKGFEIHLNGKKISGFPFTIRESSEFKPIRLKYTDSSGIDVEIFGGMAGLPPDDLQPKDGWSESDYFGWYVICNDRVVVAADKSDQTVWGDDRFPNWHFQYNGFIGVVSFESKDANLLPWRTTKRDVDESNEVYRRAVAKMKDVSRVWIDYTNDRKNDLVNAKAKEAVAEAKPLFKVQYSETLDVPKITKMKSVAVSSIQYARPNAEIVRVKKSLGNTSMSNAKAGELTFEYYMKNELED